MIHVVSPDEGTLGTLRILAGADATRGHYFAFESETAPSTAGSALDVHAHSAYDESEYVLTGLREIVIEEQRWEARAGFFALAPRHALHGMRTIGSEQSRWIHFFSPAGIESYFRERERLRERGATADELRALSVQHGASAPASPVVAVEPAYSSSGTEVVATGRDTRDAYALAERTTLPREVHTHADQEEAFYVIDAELIVEAEGNTTRLGAGSFALIPRGLPHRHVIAQGGRVLAVYSPGHALQHAMNQDAPPAVNAWPGATEPRAASVNGLASQSLLR